MECTRFQQNELKRIGYYTYPLPEELKNITNFIFNTVDSIYTDVDEQEINDYEIDPPLSKLSTCYFNLYDF